ncbi:MAG: sulfur carrier protein ThiS [Clostridiales bacterium]|nr:sulfur carrier protein ThiS [Clostridiales bacterium]
MRELLIKKEVKVHDYVTVQINGEIVPNAEYDTFVVHDGDEAEFLYFMGGGR